MTNFSDSTTANLRLSNAERDEAIAALSSQVSEGRLSAAEFAERSATARTAVTRGDLAPLFSDLPAAGGSQATGSPTAAFTGTNPLPAMGARPMGEARKDPIGGTAGRIAVALSPFIALILFFLTGANVSWAYSWLWFLLVPITGAIAYGGGTHWGKDR